MDTWQGKKVLIMGLGLHGGGRTAAEWFFGQGARVTVTDQKTEEHLASSLAKLQTYTGTYRSTHPDVHTYDIQYVLGKHQEKDFRDTDLIIQNPGVPRESPYLRIAESGGVPIENEATFFFSSLPTDALTIAVTGTRGKSTTTALIADMARRTWPHTLCAGIATHSGAQSFFPLLEAVSKVKGSTPVLVVELSSWQLELFAKRRLRPHVAVITNVLRDHLNRYASFEEYAHAKKNIAAFQHSTDAVILNADNEMTRALSTNLSSQVYWFSQSSRIRMRGTTVHGTTLVFQDGAGEEEIATLEGRKLRGNHNIENILAAVTAAKIVGIGRAAIEATLKNFIGVPDRMEYLCAIGERSFYNDTTATSPDATAAAVRTLSPDGPLILLCGGSDKDLDFRDLASILKSRVKGVVLFSGTAMPKIIEALRAVDYEGPLTIANSMADAVAKAWSMSGTHDIILLSPGAASFGMFKHEFDRGEQFRAEIEKLKENI